MISFIVGWSIGFIVGWVLAIFTEDMEEFKDTDPDVEHFIKHKNKQ